MQPDEKLSVLEDNNPFTSSSAGDPWETAYPDVTSINMHVFNGIKRLILQKKKNRSLECAGLVLGEVGSGKTHLIGRLLDYALKTDAPFSFAYIQPIENPEHTFRYLLREVVVNLVRGKTSDKDFTLLDRLLGNIFKETIENKFRARDKKKFQAFLKKLTEEPTIIFKSNITPSVDDIGKRAYRFIITESPEISESFLKVLFQYHKPKKRYAAISWLKGAVIDEEHASLLDMPDRKNRTDSYLEQEAIDILISLGILMARYDQPMLICFDRLENLDTDEKIASLGRMIEFLVDKAKAMLPFTFVRGQSWEEKLKDRLNEHVVSRLETNRFELVGCKPEEALDIVRKRLEQVYGESIDTDFYPFDINELKNLYKVGGYFTPRIVITQANKKLDIILNRKDGFTDEEPLDKLYRAYENQYKSILMDFNRYEPDRNSLRRALGLYLKNYPDESGFQEESLKQAGKTEKFIDFTLLFKRKGNEQTFKAIFIIDVEQHHYSVRCGLNKGIEFLKNNPEGKAFYIRDARCPFPPPPRWIATNEVLDRFKELGGCVLFLFQEQAARWYALSLLSYAVTEGDVVVTESENQVRPVTVEELALFIQSVIHVQHFPSFKEISDALLSSSEHMRESAVRKIRDAVIRHSETILTNAPLNMMRSKKLFQLLKQEGLNIDKNDMLTALMENSDRFQIQESTDDILIKLIA